MRERSAGTVRFEGIETGTGGDCSQTIVLETIAFAREFDPLDIHTDLDPASATRFGGPIASGYHTLCFSTRLLAEAVQHQRGVAGYVIIG
jgi:acyl dehydratase